MMSESAEKEAQSATPGAAPESISLEVHGSGDANSPQTPPASNSPKPPPPSQQTGGDKQSYRGSRHSSIRATTPNAPKKDLANVDFVVAGEDASKVSIPSASHINLDVRDPEHINHHLKVAFAEIFAEPHPTVFSFDFIWQASFKSFTLVKLWTYRIISVICGIPAAVCWALYFACMAFCHIWCCVPCLRQFTVNMGLARKFFDVLMDCCISPICLSIGKLFSSIRISVIKTSDYIDSHQV